MCWASRGVPPTPQGSRTTVGVFDACASTDSRKTLNGSPLAPTTNLQRRRHRLKPVLLAGPSGTTFLLTSDLDSWRCRWARLATASWICRVAFSRAACIYGGLDLSAEVLEHAHKLQLMLVVWSVRCRRHGAASGALGRGANANDRPLGFHLQAIIPAYRVPHTHTHKSGAMQSAALLCVSLSTSRTQ